MSPTEFLDRKFASGKPRRCWMCGCCLTRGTASVDHLQPKSRGGKNGADNYKLACKPCNSGRGNAPMSRVQRDALKGCSQKTRRDYGGLSAAIKRARSTPTT